MDPIGPEDRLDGPGFTDHLIGKPPPHDCPDGLLLARPEHKAARDVWHRVLVAHLTERNGATLDELSGGIGWFFLRLTRQEASDLIDSAKVTPTPSITRELPYTAAGAPIPDDEVRWVATMRGADPRGASFRDFGHAAGNALRTMVGRVLGLISALVTLAGAVGFVVSSGSAVALQLFTAGVWVGVLALVLGGLRHERALTAAALAWPRLLPYRPARWDFENLKWRSPQPWALLGVATVVALFVSNVIWRVDVHLKAVPWWAGVAVALMLGINAFACVRLRAHSRPWREAYEQEYKCQRKPEFRTPPNPT